MVSILLES